MSDDLALLNPTTRFSNRVENYIKYRPSYPPAVIAFLEERFGLNTNQRIADIGSGTGLFAEILLNKGFKVTCIEPNEEMRQAGEQKLGHFAGFTSRRHKAEHTGLRNHSVDLITVAQAFHWMEPIATKQEFQRILKPGGRIVLAWNLRLTTTPFLIAYDALKRKYAMEQINFEKVVVQNIEEFFKPAAVGIEVFSNIQLLDFDALKGQLLSASYIPLPGHESYDEMISELIQLFVAYNENGRIKMEYETKLYWNNY